MYQPVLWIIYLAHWKSTSQMHRPRVRSRLVRINFTSTGLTQKKKLESLGIGTEKLFENSLVAVGILSEESPKSAFLLLNIIPGWHAAVHGTQVGLTEAETSQWPTRRNRQTSFLFFQVGASKPGRSRRSRSLQVIRLTLSSSCLTNQWIHFSSKRQHNTWFTSGSVSL